MKLLKIKNVLIIALILSISSLPILAGTVIPIQTNGILKSPKPKTVTVDGLSAQNGMTIKSGAKIITGEVGAQISILGVGNIVLGPNSVATLTYDSNGVNLVLTTGSSSVATVKGKSGKLTDPTGKVSESQITLDSDLLKYPSDGTRVPLALNSFSKISTLGWVAIIGGGVAAVVIPLVATISNRRP